MQTARQIIRRPLLSEKSTLLKERHNQVVLEVAREANKIEIKKAVEEIFGVKVSRVNVIRMQGKKKRVSWRHEGRKPEWKKAYVTLAEGETIDFFEGSI